VIVTSWNKAQRAGCVFGSDPIAVARGCCQSLVVVRGLVDVPICAKLVHPAPWQRSPGIGLMVPPASVEAVQDNVV